MGAPEWAYHYWQASVGTATEGRRARGLAPLSGSWTLPNVRSASGCGLPAQTCRPGVRPHGEWGGPSRGGWAGEEGRGQAAAAERCGEAGVGGPIGWGHTPRTEHPARSLGLIRMHTPLPSSCPRSREKTPRPFTSAGNTPQQQGTVPHHGEGAGGVLWRMGWGGGGQGGGGQGGAGRQSAAGGPSADGGGPGEPLGVVGGEGRVTRFRPHLRGHLAEPPCRWPAPPRSCHPGTPSAHGHGTQRCPQRCHESMRPPNPFPPFPLPNILSSPL